MDATPDLAAIGRLLGDPTRATMLTGLLAGRALTAGELARGGRVTKQTASAHLAKLTAARLVAVEAVGRHRYFRLRDHHVAAAIESLMALAQRVGAVQVDTGPADPALRKARVCYDHLAGELGVLLFDGLAAQGHLRVTGTAVTLTEGGAMFFARWGIDVAALTRARRPLCRACLDWSERRHHLAGALGAAALDRCLALGWARRRAHSRAITFFAGGERALRARFQLAASEYRLSGVSTDIY